MFASLCWAAQELVMLLFLDAWAFVGLEKVQVRACIPRLLSNIVMPRCLHVKFGQASVCASLASVRCRGWLNSIP